LLRNFIRESWPLLLPVLAGFLAVYWLLPQARRSKPIWGVLAGGIALVLGATLLVRVEANLAEAILFYSFAGIAVVAGAMMLAQKNPVHAALAFALVVLSTCGLFLLQGAPFLMAATIVVYAGAIVVTFLFVIMLAQQEGLASADQRSREPLLASLAGFVLLAAIAGVLQRTYDTSPLEELLGPVRQAAEAATADDIRRHLGAVKGQRLDIAERLTEAMGDQETSILVHNLERAVAREPMDVNAVQGLCNKILDEGEALRVGHGSLLPRDSLPLSKLSGAAANEPFSRGSDSRIRERLPAANVAALGKSLFTDYLIPVQLAGMLLLVATIGAIVIAGRRPEGLR
jgi:NADH-quinone oxidoreductase subunit J